MFIIALKIRIAKGKVISNLQKFKSEILEYYIKNLFKFGKAA